jgi:Holliday junction DNA helicase RuvA
MIAQLRGTVAARFLDHFVLDVGGIGFELQASARTLAELPAVGDPAVVQTICVLRAESITIVGFGSQLERETFSLLVSVPGVGLKTALSVLSCVSARELCRAIREKDPAMLRGIPGVGKRLIDRILVDLDGKIQKIEDLQQTREGVSETPPFGEAVEALRGLGFSEREASGWVRTSQQMNPSASLEETIRLALREAGRRSE